MYVAPPAKDSPVRAAVRPWIRALEWFLFESSKGTSRYARLMISILVIGGIVFLLGLAVVV